MGRKDRELSIFGLTPATDLTALTEVFAQHGPCKPVFFIHGSTVSRAPSLSRRDAALHAVSHNVFDARAVSSGGPGPKLQLPAC